MRNRALFQKLPSKHLRLAAVTTFLRLAAENTGGGFPVSPKYQCDLKFSSSSYIFLPRVLQHGKSLFLTVSNFFLLEIPKVAFLFLTDLHRR